MYKTNQNNQKWLRGQGLAAQPSAVGRTPTQDTSRHPRLLLYGKNRSRKIPVPVMSLHTEMSSKN